MGSSCSIDRRDEEQWCRPHITQSIKRKKKKKNMDHERRKHLLEALNAEAQTNELLSRIPGRICNNGSTSSACAFTQQGKKGTNQDAMVVWEHYASRKDTLLCGVFDGHGPYGHLVAGRVRDTLPSKLMGMWKARMRGEIDIEDEDDDEEEESEELVGYDNGIHSVQQQHQEGVSTHHHSWDQNEQQMLGLAMKMWRECIVKTFHRMDRELRIQPTIDCFCSGTTAVILLQQGRELILGNVGDSRAVLATFGHPDASSCVKAEMLQAVQLTLDLKPSLPREAERIRRCKGRVFAMQDEPEVARMWLPYDDAPGLAMARAFGDFCLKDYGLISVPDITYRTLTPEDQFVILATDGIWDVMSNRQAVEVVSSAPSRVTAARLLVETAVRGWRLKYPTSKVDDCAVICLFFHREASTTVRRTPPTTTSSYYYTQEEEEEDDEDQDEEHMEGNASTYKPVPAPAPTPATPSPSEQSNGDEQQLAHKHKSSNVEVLQANESGEISWGRSMTVGSSTQHTKYTEDSLQNAHKSNYAEMEATPSPVLEIQEVLSSSMQGKARSLAEYMNDEEEKEEEVEEEWSALEGVVRVNSILNLPRFKVGDSPSFR